MIWIPALLALASNVDNTQVGLLYGMKERKIPVAAILLAAVSGSMASALANALSKWFLSILPGTYWSTWMGGTVQILLGVRALFSVDRTSTYFHILLEKKWWFLALGLSINNLGIGLSAGLLGYNPVLFGIVVGMAGGVLLWLGSLLGQKLQTYPLSKWIYPLSALCLILMGLYNLL
ncbi:hypothetical protein GCM10011571_35670 [Marinithermofilum abyssi]|uniref:Mn2+ efflux pump MntP n=1 Tax=Marinithermofilum abyssi TaxID=1571185 RepID=A0A8J2VL54_9BACL|nr:manganese efflux pump [Marinithermofilum abyssi]GGE30303.1 hypothetical protein GCM10011571_35670 [Marinithermofilum abyssi]